MFSLPALPYDKDALEPHISAETLKFHHEKHHNTYVQNLNKLIADTAFEGLSLEDIIKKSAGDADHAGIFNNAAQVWNHTFYWNSMRPDGGGHPISTLSHQIEEDFGSYAEFEERFKKAAATQFGSGWAWLVWNGEALEIVKTPNAHTPITEGHTPLLTCDVWEHAYYLDYQNRRPDYVSTFLKYLVNWDFAQENFDAARA